MRMMAPMLRIIARRLRLNTAIYRRRRGCGACVGYSSRRSRSGVNGRRTITQSIRQGWHEATRERT